VGADSIEGAASPGQACRMPTIRQSADAGRLLAGHADTMARTAPNAVAHLDCGNRVTPVAKAPPPGGIATVCSFPCAQQIWDALYRRSPACGRNARPPT
jgi:hypothetical protein